MLKDAVIDAAGRRQSLHAFRLYALATVFVLWAAASGALRLPGEGSPTPLLLLEIVWVVSVGRGLWLLRER